MSSVPLDGRPSPTTTRHLRLGDKGLPPTRRCPAALGRAGPGRGAERGRRARPRPHTHPLVRRMMSPGWMRPPISSHTEMVMLPVLSATLQDLTSCPSFVLVTRPAGRSAAQGGGGPGRGARPRQPAPTTATRDTRGRPGGGACRTPLTDLQHNKDDI